MGRPKKQADLLMNVPLRILLTADQKQLIEDAANLDQMDMSEWSRRLLVKAANERVAKAMKKQSEK
jgi:hypothetical protein